MDITIIGTGNMARGIATRALGAGHVVTLLGTETEKAQALGYLHMAMQQPLEMNYSSAVKVLS
jgi:3-hydroxyisobutyrate dehydrogenase-like beta-hydroxyacid dehydrogenase